MGSKDFFHILTSEYERPCPKDMPGTPNSIFTKTNRVAVWASPHDLYLPNAAHSCCLIGYSTWSNKGAQDILIGTLILPFEYVAGAIRIQVIYVFHSLFQ